MKQCLLPIIVKKHNKIIRTKQKALSVQGARALQTLIAHIKESEQENNLVSSVSVRVQDIFSLQEAGGGAYKRIQSFVDELGQCTIGIETQLLNEAPIYELYPFFSKITYKNGIIKANFNYLLQEYLLAIKEVTYYNLLEFKLLKSSYAQRIFEILKSWVNLPQGFKDIDLKELHDFLDTPESLRKDFRKFRVKVLEVAHKDILKNTDFFYNWEAIKKGSGVTSPVVKIRFSFKKEEETEEVARTEEPTYQNILDCIKSPMQEWKEEKQQSKQ